MPKQALPRQTFNFSEIDRRVLTATKDDLTLFCQWYFGITPLTWQHLFYHKPQKRKIAVAGIRAGKTYGASLGFVHFALFHPYSRIANASISADQAKIVFFNVLDLVTRPNFVHLVADIKKHPYPEIELVNGSKLWFRSVGYEAELWRGWEFDWINGDEFGYVNSEIAVKTLTGRLLGNNTLLKPPQPRYGLFTITTSPRGRGWLYEMWRKGDSRYSDLEEYNPERYLSMRVRTMDNIHINREELDALWAEYSDRQRRQELEGEFLDPEDAVFNYEDLTAMCDPNRKEVKQLIDEITFLDDPTNPNPGIKHFDRQDYSHFELAPQRDREYLCTWDLGTTATRHMGRNATVGFVIDITTKPWRVVAFRRETQATYGLIINWIKEWHQKYANRGQNMVETVIDATGSGKPVEEILQDEHNIDVEGFQYTVASKPDAINAGQVCIERGYIIMPPIRRVLDEFSSYEIDDRKITQDCVMALCQGLYRARIRKGDYSRTGPLILPTRTMGRNQSIALASDRYRQRRTGARNIRTGRPRR